MIEIILAIIIGCIAGIITGLIPGIHINTVTVLLISISAFLLELTSPLMLGVFIISMGIFHTFMNVIPSIFLGAPEEATALAVLPGHKLLLEGKGYEAVSLTIIGSLFGLYFVILIIPFMLVFIPGIYSYIKDYIAFILIFASIYLIIKDHKSRFWAFSVFFIAGILGIFVLNSPTINPLFPMLSGLFGLPTLITSIKEKTVVPKQKICKSNINKKEISKSVFSGLIASLFCGLLPGIGSAQAAIMGSSFSKKWTERTFLVLVGSIDTIVFFLSLIAFYTINKARSGAIVALSKLIENISLNDLFLFVGVSLIAAGLATILTLIVSKTSTRLITKMDYQKISIAIIIFIIILSIILSGFLGLYILIVSTFVGLLPIFKRINRSHLMGCLILPVILFFLL